MSNVINKISGVVVLNDTILYNDSLISGSTSIYSSTPQDVKVYTITSSNKDLDVNVTATIGTFISHSGITTTNINE